MASAHTLQFAPGSASRSFWFDTLTIPQLPVDEYLPFIQQSLAEGNCLILEAAPGAGKTTRVAPSLLDLSCFEGAIAVVQPRRIAARAAAAHIAWQRQSALGDQVGYQVRFDSRCGRDTRLICMTPGILLRRLQSDPLLEKFSVIVLDEFHERSQEMDLLLGMVRQLQKQLRPELRIVVMSATLETQELSDYLQQPRLIQVPGRSFPVDIRFSRFEAPQRTGLVRRIVEATSKCILKAATTHQGDMLVFLPGVGEIMQVLREIESASLADCDLLPLYGDLPPQEQDRVLQPGNRRRIILATNIAETSLTIDGVCIVVDSGWARVKRFCPETGLDSLQLEPIAQASATQRAGRAGRTRPGICYRLWDEVTHRARSAQLQPELLRTDLSSAVLQLLQWGETPEQFAWITPPSSESIAQARRVLEMLEAIQGDQLTGLGKLLLQFPLHPRLARLLVESHRLGISTAGCMAAAMLSERDLFMKPQQSTQARSGNRLKLPTSAAGDWQCDLTKRLEVWSEFINDGQVETSLGTINRSSARNLSQVTQQFSQLQYQELGSSSDQPLDGQLSRALLVAFPDRLAKRRTPVSPRAVMVGGKGVQLATSSGVRSELFLCLDLDAGGAEANVRMASGIQQSWLPEKSLRQVDESFFHPSQQAIVTRRRLYWLDLLLEEAPVTTPLNLDTARLLSVQAAGQFEKLLPTKDKELHSLLGRLRWLLAAMPDADLPALEGDLLASRLVDWCMGLRSIAELKQLPWKQLVQQLLTPAQRQLMDQQAPESITLPTGRTVWLQYEPGKPPVLEARIQEFFGWKATPYLAGGRVPLLLHLLAPNGRCQQITDDLASFWRNGYPLVRKELRGRYPKHSWPENPEFGS